MPSFQTDIRPLFRQSDGDAMLNATLVGGAANVIDLTKYDQVKAKANAILASLQAAPPQQMPCDAPWSQDMINTFIAWMNAGFPEFDPVPPQIAVKTPPGTLINFNDVP